MIRDAHSRPVDYLRVSLTRACQMRCSYCRSRRLQVARDDQLTPTELECVVRHLVRRGLKKVRLTGGDPTMRPDLLEVIERLSGVGLEQLAMTTNGLSLADHAHAYARAGLDRINVSLDTMDPTRFARMTGVDALDQVVAGIDAAVKEGLLPVRLNTVVVRGENDSDLEALVRFAAGRGLAIRFIELMPMGPLVGSWSSRFLPEREMRSRLSCITTWTAVPQGADSARHYRVCLDDGQAATVGFIAPMSCSFCGSCARLRVDSSGSLYPCLMGPAVGSLVGALRPELRSGELHRIVAQALAIKPPEHPGRGLVAMSNIGG